MLHRYVVVGEITVLSVFCRKALIKVSCYCCFIIGSNILVVTLKCSDNRISCLAYISSLTCSASDQINEVLTSVIYVNHTFESFLIGAGSNFVTQINFRVVSAIFWSFTWGFLNM